MATLEEIENNNRVEKSRRKIAGFPDKRWMEEIDWLIAEVKRLREQVDQFQQDKKRLDWLEEYAFIQVPDFDHFNAALRHPFRTAMPDR